MAIQKTLPTLACDVCGFTVECTHGSKEYNMFNLHIRRFEWDSSIPDRYKLQLSHVFSKKDLCSDCLRKILEESPTLQKLNNM